MHQVQTNDRGISSNVKKKVPRMRKYWLRNVVQREKIEMFSIKTGGRSPQAITWNAKGQK